MACGVGWLVLPQPWVWTVLGVSFEKEREGGREGGDMLYLLLYTTYSVNLPRSPASDPALPSPLPPSLPPSLPFSLPFPQTYWLMGLFYEWAHFSVHTRVRPRTALGKAIKSHHTKHHLKDERLWFAFSWPRIDSLLGTVPRREKGREGGREGRSRSSPE